MVLPPQGRESLGRLVIRGTEVISSDRVLRNIERFEPNVPLKSDHRNIVTLPFPVINAFAFRNIYKAEEYDFATETWVDVTTNYNWNLLTDMKGTYLSFSVTANVDRRFRLWIDLGSYPLYIGAVAISFIHSGYVKEMIVEDSTSSDFSTVYTRLNWTGNFYFSDDIVYWKLDSIADRRYVRITFTFYKPADGTIHIKQIFGLTNKIPWWLYEWQSPFDWDKDRNIYPVADNSKDLGTSSRRWRDLWVGRNVYIAGKVGIGTTSPVGKLHVTGDLRIEPSNEAAVIRLFGSRPDGLTGGRNVISFFDLAGQTDPDRTDFTIVQVGGSEGGQASLRIISLNSAGGWKNHILNMFHDGYVGIMHSNPIERLHVNGNIRGQNIYPDADNTYNIGSSTLRWANGYFVNVITGDIGFEELSCPVCGQQFKVNDSVVLKVRKVDNDKIMCVPVHTTCNPHELPEEQLTEPVQEEDRRLEIIPEPSFEITAIEPADENRMYVQAKFEDGIVVWITADIEASEDEITAKIKEAYVNEKKRIIEDEERKKKGAEKIRMVKERLIGMKKKVEIKADEIKTAEIAGKNDEFRKNI